MSSERAKIIKKSIDIVKDLESKYDNKGNLNKSYFDELVKDEFAEKRKKQTSLSDFDDTKINMPPKPEIQQAPNVAPPKVSDTNNIAPQNKPMQTPPELNPNDIKSPKEIATPDISNAPRVVEPPKQIYENDFRQELKDTFPDLVGVLKPSGDPMKNKLNVRAFELVKEGEITPEQFPLLTKIMVKMNNSRSVDEYFDNLMVLGMDENVANSRFFSHLRKSVNKHIQLNPEVKESIAKIFKTKIIEPGFENDSNVKNILYGALESLPENTTIKELGNHIGKQLLNYLGPLDVKTERLDPATQFMREEAMKLNKVLRPYMALDLLFSKTNFGTKLGAARIKENYGLELSNEEKALIDVYRKKMTVKSMDDDLDDVLIVRRN